MSIDEINAFGRALEVIDNRLKVLNQMLGYTRVGAADNPVRLRVARGCYMVEIEGEELDSFGIWDLEEAERVIGRLSAINDGMWLTMRQGLVRVA